MCRQLLLFVKLLVQTSRSSFWKIVLMNILYSNNSFSINFRRCVFCLLTTVYIVHTQNLCTTTNQTQDCKLMNYDLYESRGPMNSLLAIEVRNLTCKASVSRLTIKNCCLMSHRRQAVWIFVALVLFMKFICCCVRATEILFISYGLFFLTRNPLTKRDMRTCAVTRM